MITENLTILKINKLSQKQYNRESVAGNLNENEIYLTPDTSLTVWQPNTEYQVGDVVIAKFEEYMDLQDQNDYNIVPNRTVIAKCVEQHTSQNIFSLYYVVDGRNKLTWEILQETYAYYDALGRRIHNTYVTKDYVDSHLSGGITRVITDTLPSEPSENVIYMIPSQNSTENNVYDEYMFFDDNGMLMPEIIGSTAVDLSEYLPLSGGTIEGSLLLIDEEGYVQGHMDASGVTFYAPGLSSSFVAGGLQIAAGGEYILIGTNSVDGSDSAKAAWQQWLDVLTSLKDGTQVNSLYQKTEKDDTALPLGFAELHSEVKEQIKGTYDKVEDTGENATSLGTSIAKGKRSFAGGSSNLSTGKASVTIGADNYNAGDNGATFGYANAMLGDYGLVGGSKHILRDNNQTVGGHGNDVSGHCANAFGDGLIVRGYGQTVIGTYNNPVQDAKLIIGDGSLDARHNIFVITKEGNAYINDKEMATKEEIGNIETALDSIIAIQENLIGGDA